MPEMSGIELCSKVKNNSNTSHIPFILLSINNDKKSMEEGLKVGVDDYIPKPFDINLLKIKIDNIIQNRKLLRVKFLGIQELVEEKDAIANDFNNEFVAKAVEIIEANISSPSFSITDLSRELCVSRSLLFSKFNSITGYTPNEFVKVIKMKRAIEYFKEKKYTISEVALMVGFDEPAYFSTCFKKIYAKSPSAFIEENLK